MEIAEIEVEGTEAITKVLEGRRPWKVAFGIRTGNGLPFVLNGRSMLGEEIWGENGSGENKFRTGSFGTIVGPCII